ncbi:MAG: homoserine kinase [Nanoarchaeota archaeon]
MEWVKVFAPATVANVGPGFDILGFAVKNIGDIVEARKTGSGIKISSIESEYPLTKAPEGNAVSIAASEVLKMLKEKNGLEIKLKKGIPHSAGMGSSAASAAAGAFAANCLYGNKLSKEELIEPATKAEGVLAGYHADNTGPSLLGGATLVKYSKSLYSKNLDVVKIGFIDELKVILVTPEFRILTREARRILPTEVPMKSFIANMGNSCMITAAFAKNDYSLLARSINDVIVEPVRSKLIKGFDEVKKAALDAGADGMTISGSGSTVFAITNNESKAMEIKKAMVEAFSKAGVESKGVVTEMDPEGTRLIK